MGVERWPREEAASISARARERTPGVVSMKRRMEPRAVPVVSAPAWMRRETWARFWVGVRGAPVEKRASRQLSWGV